MVWLSNTSIGAIPAAVATAIRPMVVAADDPCAGLSGAQAATCHVTQGVAGVAGGFAQSAAQQAEQALTQWVVDTAVWLLNQLANVILSTSAPDLNAGWRSEERRVGKE